MHKWCMMGFQYYFELYCRITHSGFIVLVTRYGALIFKFDSDFISQSVAINIKDPKGAELVGKVRQETKVLHCGFR